MESTAPANPNAPAAETGLGSPSFQGLLWTNWLTAINDNVIRWLVIGIGKDFFEPKHHGWVLMLGTACYVLPFMLLAAPAGYLADRFPKRNVIVICKIVEVVLMLLAWAAILSNNFWILLFVVFLMGAQSALFSPSKFGILPEMMGSEKISAANGYFNLATLTATVVGMALGGWLKDQTGFRSTEYHPFLIASVTVGIALTGTLVSLLIRKAPAANPKLKFPFNMVQQTMRDITQLYANGPLYRVSLGIVFFWAIAILGQLNIDQFAFESGAIFESDRTPLLISLILGVGIGSVLAGTVSSGRIELGIVPWGAVGIAAMSLLLFVSPHGFINDAPGIDRNLIYVCLLLGGLGASAGFFQVPLAAYLQHRSPIETRGAILSANNFMVFAAILLSALFFSALRTPVYTGNFSHLPLDYQMVDLNDRKISQQLESAVENLKAKLVTPDGDPSPGSPPTSDSPESRSVAGTFIEFLPDFVAPDLREASLARLVWIDLQFRRSIDESFPIETYLQRYPELSRELLEDLESRLVKQPDTALQLFPSEVKIPAISDEDGVRQRQMLEDFESIWRLTKQWNGANAIKRPMQLECDLFRLADSNARNVVLANLAWTEMEYARSIELPSTANDYYQMFPLDMGAKRVLKNVLLQINGLPFLTSRKIFLVMCLLTLPIAYYSITRLPQAMVRIALWWVMKCFYRIRVNGLNHIPENGSAVLVCNHSTYLDGLLILLMLSRRIRMIAFKGNFKSRSMTGLAKFAGTILITGGPKSIQKGLAEARKALGRGELVGLFPEGGLTRSGQIQGFKPGVMRILDQMPVSIIPVYIDQIWGSIFSYAGGKIVYKMPKRFRPPITINLGKPIPRPETVHLVRQSVLELGADSVNDRQPPFVAPQQSFIRKCKRRKFKMKLADSTGVTASGGQFLTRCLVARSLLRKHVLADDERVVGVLIPPSVGSVAVNMALALDRRVVVNLNYTVSNEIMNACIKEAGIRHVLTTRKVMEKFDFDFDAEVFYLEDLKDKVTISQKAVAAFQAFAMPSRLLERRLKVHQVAADEVITVIFTSGSTGIPKGVMLTARNVATNVEAIGQVINLNRDDTLIGVLPFFHSFGYTITMWGPMGLDIRSAYHFNPLEAKQVAKLVQKYSGTVLLGTPTFLRSYIRRCTRDEFKTIDTVVAGAEKLPVELSDAFENRFGVRPVEGYGATELSPLATVNIPPSRSIKNFQVDNREGTVGRTIPNVAAKVTDVDDPSKELDSDQPGMIWIKGPNVMKGYLNRPDLTSEVVCDGWYKTGDIGLIDREGFVKITGRLSRFSKIGGEMVPHIQIEEILLSLLDEQDQEEPPLAVTAVPDAKKGERLIVLYHEIDKTVDELRAGLSEAGLPNIFIPAADSFCKVASIPVLGTGKLDLRSVKDVALSIFSENGEADEPA